MKIVLERVPAFQARWREHLAYWDGEEAGLCLDLAEFARYIVDLVGQGELENLPGIYDLIEELMKEGDETVQDAVATCLLESLGNAVSAGKLDPSQFGKYLGSASRAYCRAWDDFTGVETPGL